MAIIIRNAARRDQSNPGIHLFQNKKRNQVILSLSLFLLTIFFYLSVDAQAKPAQVSPAYAESIPLSYIFTVLFLMLGPFKIIGPFVKITRDADRSLSRNMALQASLYSSIALCIAAFLGQAILKKYDISIPILSLAGGIILFLVALIAIIQQFQPAIADNETKAVPTLKMALTPLAFPTIVTPYGIATLIVFLALSPDLNSRLGIGMMVFGIMLLNLVFMLITRFISQKTFQVLAVLLQILASVLGIVQVALGLKIVYKAINVLLHS